MKTLHILIVNILTQISLPAFAQSEIPASQRKDKIERGWSDRAFYMKAARPEGRNVLWYRQSAKVWEEALPIANGKLGAIDRKSVV